MRPSARTQAAQVPALGACPDSVIFLLVPRAPRPGSFFFSPLGPNAPEMSRRAKLAERT